MRIISLLLFFIALGVLVTIHEFGHFLSAKAFKVYCSDFSIGFGYKLLKIGRKEQVDRKSCLFFINRKNPKAETTFSIGVVPLGGYVAMLGEDEDEVLKDKPELKERSVEDLALWKKLIVFFGGVFMNFVLAWIIFFISAACFEQKSTNYINQVSINDSNLTKETLTKDKEGNEPLVFDNPSSFDGKTGTSTIIYVYEKEDNSGAYSLNDPNYPIKIEGNKNYYSLVFDTNNVGLNNLDFSNSFKLAVAEKDSDGLYFPKLINKNFEYFNFETNVDYKIDPVKVLFHTVNGDSNENQIVKQFDGYIHLTVDKKDAKFNTLGFGTFVYSYWNGWKSFEVASKEWAESTSLISETIGKLFYNSETWNQVGGPVAIFTQTTSILTNFPFYYYLNSWAMISVNLALFNLLPFPGLDGWSILVALIEGIVNAVKKSKNKIKSAKATSNDENKKEVNIGEKIDTKNNEKPWKINPKVKNVVSYIGLGLIFLLAILIFIKDIINLF